MTAAQLMKRLVGILKNPPEKGNQFEYMRKIKGYRLSPEGIDLLYDYLIDRHTFFPSIAQVAEAVEDMRRMAVKDAKDQIWQTFSIGDHRYARSCPDPMRPPTLPDTASDPNIVIPPEAQARIEPCSRDEARGAFLKGWLESGAEGNKAMAMFRMLEPEKAKPLKMAMPEPDLVPVEITDDDIPF